MKIYSSTGFLLLMVAFLFANCKADHIVLDELVLITGKTSKKRFFYGEAGKKQYFNEKSDLVAIETSDASAILPELNNVNGVVNVEQLTQNVLLVTIDKHFSQSSKFFNKFKVFFLPVLEYHDGTLQIPMSTIYLKSKKLELTELIKKAGISKILLSSEIVDASEKIYELKLVSGFDSLELANKLYEKGYCDYAEPSFLRIMKGMFR